MTDPMFAASVAIVRRQDILLIERNRPPSEGLWTLPGGRLEPGETAEACAEREILEELGLTVFGLRKLIVLQHGAYRLQTFATEVYDGEVSPDPAEIRNWAWVSRNNAGRLRTTPNLDRVLEAALRIFDRS
jgi:8-oxo-dGTP diphosphatase